MGGVRAHFDGPADWPGKLMGGSSSGRPAPSLVSSSMNDNEAADDEGTSRKFMTLSRCGVNVGVQWPSAKVSSNDRAHLASPSALRRKPPPPYDESLSMLGQYNCLSKFEINADCE